MLFVLLLLLLRMLLVISLPLTLLLEIKRKYNCIHCDHVMSIHL